MTPAEMLALAEQSERRVDTVIGIGLGDPFAPDVKRLCAALREAVALVAKSDEVAQAFVRAASAASDDARAAKEIAIRGWRAAMVGLGEGDEALHVEAVDALRSLGVDP